MLSKGLAAHSSQGMSRGFVLSSHNHGEAFRIWRGTVSITGRSGLGGKRPWLLELMVGMGLVLVPMKHQVLGWSLIFLLGMTAGGDMGKLCGLATAFAKHLC